MNTKARSEASSNPVQTQVRQEVDALKGRCYQTPLFVVGGQEICSPCLEIFGGSLRVPYIVCSSASKLSYHSDVKTLDVVAESAVEEILSSKLKGSYRVIGVQTEGLVAYEVAMQLAALDKRVTFAGMIDTRPHYYSAEADRFRFKNRCVFCRTLLGETPSTPQRVLSRDRFSYSIYPAPFRSTVFALSPESAMQITQQWNAVSLMSTLSIEQRQVFRKEGQTFIDWLRKVGETLSYSIETSEETRPISESNSDPLIALRRSPDRFSPIVLCVPGAGDNVTTFDELTSHIRPDYAIYGLQPQGIDRDSIPRRSVPSVTKFFLRAMKALNLHRELHILGHSFGGIVAFDLAVKMCNEGHPVKSLTLLDSTPPSLWQELDRGWTRAELIMQIVRSVELRIEDSLGVDLTQLAGRSEEQQLTVVHRRLVARRLLPKTSNWVILQGPMRSLNAALRTRYTPRGTFNGSAYSIVATDNFEFNETSDQAEANKLLHWKTALPNIVRKNTPGNHITMLLGKNAERLAEQLSFNCQ